MQIRGGYKFNPEVAQKSLYDHILEVRKEITIVAFLSFYINTDRNFYLIQIVS